MVQLWFRLLCPDVRWFSCGSAFVQLWFCWLSPDVMWPHFGSDVVQVCAWHDCVWLSFGSVVGGLSSDGAAVVPSWFRLVRGLVQLWFSMGSGAGGLRLVGSAWVQLVPVVI